MRLDILGGAALATVMLASGLFLGHEVMADGGDSDVDGGERTVSRLASGPGFTYQGRLQAGGVPVDGTCDFEFSMWDSLAGVSGQLGSTQTETLAVTNGRFDALLSSAGGFGGFIGDARFLETAVRCPAGSGSFETLNPRQQMTGTPYALGLVLPMTHSSSFIGDGLSITNSNPGAFGYAAIRGAAAYWGVAGFSGTATNPAYQKAGVYGEGDHAGVAATGNNYGVTATTVDGIGVAGTHTGGGTNPGLFGVTLSTDPGTAAIVGVQGVGFSPALPIPSGIKGMSADGVGILGHSQSDTGIIGTSTTGTGIQGYASAVTGLTFGIRGKVDSLDGVGVVAQGAGTGGTGAALEIQAGGIKVTGAGSGTDTPAFIHTATAGNISLNNTCFDNPLANNRPDAIILVTQRWDGVYNNHPIGVFYLENGGNSRWCIFNQSVADAMPVGARFNVLIINP